MGLPYKPIPFRGWVADSIPLSRDACIYIVCMDLWHPQIVTGLVTKLHIALLYDKVLFNAR